MEAQMTQIFRGVFAIDPDDPKELAYWAGRLGVSIDQLKEAVPLAANPSINALRLALAGLGYLQLDLGD